VKGENPNNEPYYYYPIGSNLTVFIDLGINSTIRLARKIDLNVGISYTHFSNGSVKLPNLGINVFAPRIGIQYIFNERPEYISQDVPKYIKEWEWLTTASSSVR